MKSYFKVFGLALLFIVSMSGLGFVTGFINIGKTRTIGKWQQNAERVVYEETQSYVHSKNQEALKFYKEYMKATDEQSRAGIRSMVSISFAEFDDKKIKSDMVRDFVMSCKY